VDYPRLNFQWKPVSSILRDAMARKWSNLNLPGALHFVTGNVIDRTPAFTNPACCEAFCDVLAELNREWPGKLIAYVLMPDHLHFISNPRDGRVKEFTGALKSLYEKRIVEVEHRYTFESIGADSDSEHRVWQESFKAMPLSSALDDLAEDQLHSCQSG
jgi:REP element-mobilizing transposase RayT